MQASLSTAEIHIPVERIVRELLKSAQPGFFGQTQIAIVLLPQALEGVEFHTRRERKIRSTDQTDQARATQQDTEREKSVRDVASRIARRLHLRSEVAAVVCHFNDGFAKDCEIVDEGKLRTE